MIGGFFVERSGLADSAIGDTHALDAARQTGMKSPSTRLVAGVLLTLLVIGGYAGYTLHAVQRVREVQSGIIERNRKASLQLIRIQSDLNALALAMRDMLDNLDGYGLSAWASQLQRIHENLDDAIRVESILVGGRRNPQQTAYLTASFQQFWTAVSGMLEMARAGKNDASREVLRRSLQPKQEALSALTARLLVENNEQEQVAAQQMALIYAEIEQNAYHFLGLAAVLVVLISMAIIRLNRVHFDRVTELSKQRSELARQLISTQESTLRSISRDLHDEFGQILTALGAMLRRAERLAPGSAFHEQIRETNVVVQETLEKIRALSQSLQPVILEEQGLAMAVEWYVTVFTRQTGIAVQYEAAEKLPEMESSTSIHIFRILQEALNNVARHAKVNETTVRLGRTGEDVWLEVEDRGVGIEDGFKAGLGLAGMRERAELLGGRLSVGKTQGMGTVIRMVVPYA